MMERTELMNTKAETPIDFVILWVDGNDPEWQREKCKYDGISQLEANSGSCRYRDWGLLKYWFRAVERNAPWVHKIYFVSCGQIPSFLNISHPRIQLVNHRDYIPEQYLPTFSSHSIENMINRIPKISNKIVLFNDDIFLNGPVRAEDFFQNDLPCYLLGTRLNRKPDPDQNAFYSAKYNAAVTVAKYYPKIDFIRKYPEKFLNRHYGLFYNALNMLLLPQKEMFNIIDQHVAVPLLKSTMDEVWEKEYELLAQTETHRFRNNTDVNHYIFRYWDIMRGNFVPYMPTNHYYELKDFNIRKAASDILHGKNQLICLNDTDQCIKFEEYRKIIQEAFEKRYPKPSSYEK